MLHVAVCFEHRVHNFPIWSSAGGWEWRVAEDARSPSVRRGPKPSRSRSRSEETDRILWLWLCRKNVVGCLCRASWESMQERRRSLSALSHLSSLHSPARAPRKRFQEHPFSPLKRSRSYSIFVENSKFDQQNDVWIGCFEMSFTESHFYWKKRKIAMPSLSDLPNGLISPPRGTLPPMKIQGLTLHSSAQIL